MNKAPLFFLILLLPVFGFTQDLRMEKDRGNTNLNKREALQQTNQNQRGVISKEDKPPITEYKIITVERDTSFLDTSLTIYKDYKFNYLRRDRFDLLPFANVGQTYNKLSYHFEDEMELFPDFGAQARHFNFFEAEDIFYYHVPTPLTELYYKTAYEQGQQLDAFFTTNINPNLNFSIAYKGLRSLGKYLNSLTSTGNFRGTINYTTENRRYKAKAHFVSQDLMNQENGGLQPFAAQQYINELEEVEDRSLLEVKFPEAQNVLFGKRFYLHHSFQLQKSDSTSVYNFELGHILNFTDKKYRFEQATASEEFLGESFHASNIRDEVKMEKVYNELFLKAGNKKLGELSLKGALLHYNYGYNSVVNLPNEHVSNRLVGDIFSAGATYKYNLGDFYFTAIAMGNVSGDFQGNALSANLFFQINQNNSASLKVSSHSKQPNFNFLLHQSDYLNYNWQNNFKNQKTNSISARLNSIDFANVEASYSQIEDYTYFYLNQDSLVRPKQSNEQVKLFKIKVNRDFTFGKFALANTILYQEVLNANNALNVPNLVTRHSFYFQEHLFRKALFLQTGFTAKYFSNYKMDGYDPVLAEFYVQNDREFKGFPTIDFFLNARIRQTRIFFKLEHLNAAFTGNNNFSAPHYPYRDFGIRFGLVWNFFL